MLPLQAGTLVSVPPLAFRGSRRRIHPTKCCRAPRAAFFDVLPGRVWVPSIDHYEATVFGHAEASFGPARTQAMARERLVPLGLRWRQRVRWRQPRGSGRVSPCLQRPALPLFQISVSSCDTLIQQRVSSASRRRPALAVELLCSAQFLLT